MKRIYKVTSLYLLLVLVSAIVISVSLDVHLLAAVKTASIGCVFKIIAAWIHGEVFSRIMVSSLDRNRYTTIRTSTIPSCPKTTRYALHSTASCTKINPGK